MEKKVLTGKFVYETFDVYSSEVGSTYPWEYLSPESQQKYEQIAQDFNIKLGLIDVTPPPASPTLPDPAQKVIEPIHFVLWYGSGIHEHASAISFTGLFHLLNEFVPWPGIHESQERYYHIRVMLQDQEIGVGYYKRIWAGTEVISEAGAAVGLDKNLYTYSFRNT